MAYSQVGIVNLALGRIGVKRIAAMSEDSVQAIAANAVWEYVRNEVLEAKDWTFAKERVALAQNATAPANKYDYAYSLPADFLRIVKPKKSDPAVYPTGAYSSSYMSGTLEIVGKTYAYIIETLADETLCLFTDYDNTDNDLYLTYIKIVTNPAKYTAHFISALAFRLAAELSLQLAESTSKFDRMLELYERSIIRAESLNQASDYVEDETGNSDWEDAGR